MRSFAQNFLSSFGLSSSRYQKSSLSNSGSNTSQVEEVLQTLYKFSEQFAANTCELLFQENQTLYRIPVDSSKVATGKINISSISEFQRELLSYAAHKKLSIEPSEDLSKIKLIWRAPAPTSEELIQRPQAKPSEQQKPDQAKESQPSKTETIEPEATKTEYPVLVLDDDPVFSSVLQRFLERNGITALVAHSADEALKLLQKQHIAVFICDMHMPETDGLSVCGRLEQLSVPHKPKVILLTSDTRNELHIESIQSGVDLFFAKNGDPRILCAHVSKELQKVREDK